MTDYAPSARMPTALLVMGVSGSGKSTAGENLAVKNSAGRSAMPTAFIPPRTSRR